MTPALHIVPSTSDFGTLAQIREVASQTDQVSRVVCLRDEANCLQGSPDLAWDSGHHTGSRFSFNMGTCTPIIPTCPTIGEKGSIVDLLESWAI